jgi:hypothetical protein
MALRLFKEMATRCLGRRRPLSETVEETYIETSLFASLESCGQHATMRRQRV